MMPQLDPPVYIIKFVGNSGKYRMHLESLIYPIVGNDNTNLLLKKLLQCGLLNYVKH